VIAERIRKQLTPRAVVLVHDGGGDRRQTLDALRTLIPELKRDGWKFDLPERTVPTRPLPRPEVAPSPVPSWARSSAVPSAAPSSSAVPSAEVSSPPVESPEPGKTPPA
jgi:hypothetical protein